MMTWFDSFIGRSIVKVLRVDSETDYKFYQPHAIFLLLDNENGLLLSATNDGNSINVEACSLTEVYNDYGIEYCESILNELKPEDELNGLVTQSIRLIAVAEYNS